MNTATRESPEALALSTAVGTAWRDVRDALSVLFTPALIAFLILLALEIVKLRIMPSTDLTAGLVEMFYDAVEAFLMTPYAIAVHRFIILGEKTMSYRIAPAEPGSSASLAGRSRSRCSTTGWRHSRCCPDRLY